MKCKDCNNTGIINGLKSGIHCQCIKGTLKYLKEYKVMLKTIKTKKLTVKTLKNFIKGVPENVEININLQGNLSIIDNSGDAFSAHQAKQDYKEVFPEKYKLTKETIISENKYKLNIFLLGE